MTTNTDASDRVQDPASTAADEGRHVADVAKEEAANVASTAASQARSVMDDAVGQVRSQLGEQATTQRDRLAGTLRSFGDDVEQMASHSAGPSLATELAHEVADRARALGSRLEEREPARLLDDLRDFARRRPGTFLLGALAAGVVAGRLLRGAADGAAAAELAGPESGTTTEPEPRAGGAAAGLTPDVLPASPPVPPAPPGQPRIEPAGRGADS